MSKSRFRDPSEQGFLRFSELGSPDYIVKTAIFFVWVFLMISVHGNTLYAIAIHKNRSITPFLTLWSHFGNGTKTYSAFYNYWERVIYCVHCSMQFLHISECRVWCAVCTVCSIQCAVSIVCSIQCAVCIVSSVLQCAVYIVCSVQYAYNQLLH